MLPLDKTLVYRLLRRVPLPLLSILVGLVCGLVTWVVLDQIQHKALREIFHKELQAQVDRRARASLVGFGQYIKHYITATRLLANHRRMFMYLEPLSWFEDEAANPAYQGRFPPWLPAGTFQNLQIHPAHILLLDPQGHKREIYRLSSRELPPELDAIDEIFLSESQVQPFLTELGGKPYLLVAEGVKDVGGVLMAYLMLVVPIDDEFLTASRKRLTLKDTSVALLDADEGRVLASSDPVNLPPGSLLEALTTDYVVTVQSFSEYNGIDLNVQYATFMPRASVEATEKRILNMERRQRLVAAMAFIAIFTLVIFLVSLRLHRIMQRISEFSQSVLRQAYPVIQDANPLFLLDEWIRQFIHLVLEKRDEMQVRYEAEIRETAALTTAIMETSPDPIITIESTGGIIEFNPTAEQVLGYTREEAIKRKLAFLVVDEADRNRFLTLLDECLVDDQLEDCEKRTGIVAVKADGSRIPMDVAIKPILLGARLVFTVYLHDVTARQRTEREVLSLAKLASESPNPVLRVTGRGVIIYANAASDPLLAYWGCSRAQTLPLYWNRRVSDSLEQGRQEEAELISDGRIYSLLLVPIVELDYVNIYGRDITEVRKAEQQARQHQVELVHVCRLSTMGEMSTGLAHELNQPLSAIVNFASGCMRRLRSGQIQEKALIDAMDQISTQAERAGEIIRRLRGLVSKQPPVRSNVDLNDIVEEVCSFVEFEARKLGIAIRLELSRKGLPVRVDYVQIEQVLLNLLRNAMDALQEVPEQRRRLVVYTVAEGAKKVRVSVRDSGEGIAPELMDQLFDPFFTTKAGGMGMGLPISQTIIKDHSGKIWATSDPGAGTLFSIVLPTHIGFANAEKRSGINQ
jgi:PAS domain S-box-containing protein